MLTQTELEAKTGPELVTIFNALPGATPIKRFTNREVGVRRILAHTVSEAPAEPFMLSTGEVVNHKKQASKTKAGNIVTKAFVDKLTPTKRGRARQQRGVFNYEAKSFRRACRRSSVKGQMVTALEKGITWQEMIAKFPDLTEDQLHRKTNEVNWWMGYAITTNEYGIIKAEG